MDLINDLLDRLPFSRGFLLILVIISLCVYKITQPIADGERAIANFQGQIEQRQKNVRESIGRLVISDRGLLDCIRESAEDRARIHPANTGGIDDVRELEMLYCRGSHIQSIAGIGQLPKLRYLDLSRNNIHSLAPLRNHSSLKSLNVLDNPLEDIEAVESLVALKELYLPDMPDMPCGDLTGLAAGVKGNYKSIDCAGKKDTDKRLLTKRQGFNGSKSSRDSSSDRLTAAQQQELLEYERETRYSK